MKNERIQRWEESKNIIWAEFLALLVRIAKMLFAHIGDEAERIINSRSFANVMSAT